VNPGKLTTSRLSRALRPLIGGVVVPIVVAVGTAQSRPTERPRVAQGGAAHQRLRTALAAYDAGQYAEAKRALGTLPATAPANFEIRELAGLIEAALGNDAAANAHLAAAVRLRPDVASR
jgi:predicted Zn-dependent protease